MLLLVMLDHSKFVKFGWVGVQAFFVLSGYLISSMLLNARGRDFMSYLKNFYWRRILRIFPLYYLALIMLTLLFVFTGIPTGMDSQWPYLYTYTFNIARAFSDLPGSAFNHLWSMSVQEQIYLLWPFLIYLLSPRKLAWLCLVLVATGPLVKLLAALTLHSSGHTETDIAIAFVYLTPFQLGGFAAGTYAALVHRGEAPSIITSWRITLPIVLAIGLLNVWYVEHTGGVMPWQTLGFPKPNVHTENLQYVWEFILINLASASLIHSVMMKDRMLSFLSTKPMVEIGKLSFGMYIIHYPIWSAITSMTNFSPFTLRGVAIFISFFIVVYLLSSWSYYKFEQRFLKLKDLFSKSKGVRARSA